MSDDYVVIVCSFCYFLQRAKNLKILSSYNHRGDEFYYETSCCQSLVCYGCIHFKGKCFACSKKNASAERKKKPKKTWIDDYSKFQEWSKFCFDYKFMLLFTGTVGVKFGTWEDVLRIAGKSSLNNVDALIRKQKFLQCYDGFVADFYSGQMLFYTLHSAPMRRLRLIELQSLQDRTEFFSNVADMAKFSRFSRKQVLNRYLFGLITVLSKRMIGDKPGIQVRLKWQLLRCCLAKKASQKLPF
jgi:hypothetical protein